MFELIPSGTNIPFMKFKIPFVVFSTLITLWALVTMVRQGFNFGVDFAGGVQLILSLPKDASPSAEKLRATFDRMGVQGVTVQEFGSKFDKKEAEYNVHFAADFLDEKVAAEHFRKALASVAKSENPVKGYRYVGLEKAYLTLSETIPLPELQKLVKSIPFGLLELVDFQQFGRDSSNEYQLSFKSIQTIVENEVAKDFVSPSGEKAVIHKVDFVGAKVGQDLKISGILSFIVTAILIFLYIFIRFDLVYAPGVVLSLLHDVAITAGLVSVFRIEFDLTMVAALLTLAGYSINDTIIVYDRIRELAASLRGKNFEEIINIAANQTLSRTIITSGTVFLTAVSLWVWGGAVIHGFAFALMVTLTFSEPKPFVRPL
jgi:preprotein translocase subunit SecF